MQLPLVPLRDVVIFPGVVTSLLVFLINILTIKSYSAD